MGFIHFNYASFTKGKFNYALDRPHEQKELQRITHHYILYSNHLFIYFIKLKIMDVMVTRSQKSTDSHKREMAFLCTELYRIPKSHIHDNDCDKKLTSQFHEHNQMTSHLIVRYLG